MKTLEEYNRRRPVYFPTNEQILLLFAEAKKECLTEIEEYEMSIEINLEKQMYKVVHRNRYSEWQDLPKGFYDPENILDSEEHKERMKMFADMGKALGKGIAEETYRAWLKIDKGDSDNVND